MRKIYIVLSVLLSSVSILIMKYAYFLYPLLCKYIVCLDILELVVVLFGFSLCILFYGVNKEFIFPAILILSNTCAYFILPDYQDYFLPGRTLGMLCVDVFIFILFFGHLVVRRYMYNIKANSKSSRK